MVLEVSQSSVQQLDVDQASLHPALELFGLHVPQLNILQGAGGREMKYQEELSPQTLPVGTV